MTYFSRARRGLALAAILFAAACASRGPTSSTSPAPAAGTISLQLLGINDFHGTLDPATGGNGRIGTTDAGGVEFLATHIAQLRATNPNTVVVAAGDLIGGSTLLSGMFHDEPTIEALGEAGLQVSSVGNHEFDEGWAELFRVQRGGCHPTDGCQDQTPFAGAKYEYLSANVQLDPARVDPRDLARSGWRPRGSGPQTLFPAYSIREVGGVRVGFIGLVLQGTTDIVSPAGIRGLTFRREVDAGNEAAAELVRQGVRTIVVLIHEGGTPRTGDPNSCDITGPIVDIANGLSNDIDVIVSGHTHRAYICTIGSKLVTSAASLGRVVTDIDLTVDRATGDVVSKAARNVVVTRDVAKDPAQTALVARYRPFYTPLATRRVGTIAAEITRTANMAGESALGDVVADAYLEGAKAVDPNVVVAFPNAGGIRSDLVGLAPAAAGAPREVVYSNVFDMLPFGNIVVVRSLTGEQIIRWLEQQFDNPSGPGDVMLQVSGLTYGYTRSRPAGQRVDRESIRIAGQPLVATQRYRVASNDFVWSGGDGFTVATEGVEPVAAGVDVDLFIAYLAKNPAVAPGPQNRYLRR